MSNASDTNALALPSSEEPKESEEVNPASEEPEEVNEEALISASNAADTNAPTSSEALIPPARDALTLPVNEHEGVEAPVPIFVVIIDAPHLIKPAPEEVNPASLESEEFNPTPEEPEEANPASEAPKKVNPELEVGVCKSFFKPTEIRSLVIFIRKFFFF